ncbi:MAG: sensor histidine kinase [Kiritimatiellae bacterium]|nr:sensor histidine kinase [Kiritimatiellia bacterium]
MRLPMTQLSALAPAAALCGNVVTNATELLTHLGFGGREGVAFALEATVVWSSTHASRAFYVKAADGYIQLIDDATWPNSLLHDGDVVIARGKSKSFVNKTGKAFTIASCRAIDVVSHTVPDPPVDTTIDDALSGRYRFRPVRIEGTIRDVFEDEIDHRYIHIVMSSGTKSIGLALPASECDGRAIAKLIGAKVRATGCYSSLFSGFRRVILTEIALHSADNIEIVRPPPEGPFAVPPLESISANETAQVMHLGRHTAKGTVIAAWQNLNFAIRTDAGAVANVRLAEGPLPECGDSVEVAGLPDTDLYRINLRRAIWRKASGSARRAPETAEPADAAALFTDGKGHYELNPSFHGRAISLRGIVTGVPSAGLNDGIVRLQCGDFTMTVDASAVPDAISGVELGSEAEISGTCILDTERWHPNEPLPRILNVSLVVRTPADVKVLSPPPWWTPARLLVLVAALLAALAAILLWNVLLRRLADKRGRELLRSRLSQEESRLKVQERTRIAVELHDTIAQNLTGVSLEIDSAEQLARKDLDGMLNHLGMASRTLQSCRNELRNCLWDLRSRALEEQDLNEAIRRTVSPLVSDVDLSIRFNVQRRRLTDDTAHVLMRIVRELVTNAVRHGGASSVKIAGNLDDDTLSFSVRDNGCGFDPDKRPGVLQGHFGLQGIRERMTQFDGVMKIESSPGEGAKVSVALKLKNHQKP